MPLLFDTLFEGIIADIFTNLIALKTRAPGLHLCALCSCLWKSTQSH